MLHLVEHVADVHVSLRGSLGARGEEGSMNENKTPVSLDLEVKELERGRKPGGCSTSSSTSLMCTCACRDTTTLDWAAKV